MKAGDIWSKSTPAAKNVDAFIDASPKHVQEKLRDLRGIILLTVPDADEVISYKMPAYKYKGQFFAGFAGFKSHVGFYPFSGSFLDAFANDLKIYKTSKGAVQFPLDQPLPVNLIKRLIKERIKNIAEASY